MIDLSTRDLAHFAKEFYSGIESELKDRLSKHKNIFSGLITDKSNRDLYEYISENIEKIISCNLEYLTTEIKKEIHDVIHKKYSSNKNFKKSFNKIFFYDEYDKWEPYKIAKNLNLNTCPYCNRSYIIPKGDDKNKFFRPDFDHFLNKAKYPYLRLSFYNLIPSCVVCNQKAKGQRVSNLKKNIYPYSEGFGTDAVFSFFPKSYREMIGRGEADIRIMVLDKKTDKGRKIANNIDLFKLNKQYSTHWQELNSILKVKILLESRPYLKSILRSVFKNDKEDLYDFLLRNQFKTEVLEKQPLAKFTKDISEELQILPLKGYIKD